MSETKYEKKEIAADRICYGQCSPLSKYEGCCFVQLAEICKSEPSNIFEDISTTSCWHFNGHHLSGVNKNVYMAVEVPSIVSRFKIPCKLVSTAVWQQSATSVFTHSLVFLLHSILLPLSLPHSLEPKFSFGVIRGPFQGLRFLMAQLPVSSSSSVAVTG